MRSVDTIRSEKLLNVIRAIVKKLRKSLESFVSALTRTIGRQLAVKMAHIAYSWGYLEALKWASDEGFARYSAICYMNTPEYYRVGLMCPARPSPPSKEDYDHGTIMIRIPVYGPKLGEKELEYVIDCIRS